MPHKSTMTLNVEKLKQEAFLEAIQELKQEYKNNLDALTKIEQMERATNGATTHK